MKWEGQVEEDKDRAEKWEVEGKGKGKVQTLRSMRSSGSTTRPDSNKVSKVMIPKSMNRDDSQDRLERSPKTRLSFKRLDSP